MIERLEKTAANHAESVNELHEHNAIHSEAIDSILLEIIPSIVEVVTANVLTILEQNNTANEEEA
jgi:hypothetical protein